ncbi:MAG TPA: hypothetical protein VH440_10710 [Candidatus Limnocylindrales bacterium]
MNDPQRILVEDHIQGLEHEAAALRAERERDRRRTDANRATAAAAAQPAVVAAAPNVDVAAIGGAPVPAAALIAGSSSDRALDVDHDSTRVRLGRWLVGVGSAIAGSPEPEGTVAMAVARSAKADQPCDDGPASLSPAA